MMIREGQISPNHFHWNKIEDIINRGGGNVVFKLWNATPDEKLAELVSRCFDLRPASIISMLDLRRPIYRQTAAFGHFGRTDIDLPWERTDRVEQLRAEAAKL